MTFATTTTTTTTITVASTTIASKKAAMQALQPLSLFALLLSPLLSTAAPITPTTPALPVSPRLQSILSDSTNSELYTYPTQLTQGIVPKAIHSHNDYWRPVPFYSALSVGAISVEADVWLYNDTLFVGHEQAALSPARTFSSLYIDPILSVLRQTNPHTQFTSPSATPNGVFDTSSGQTLYLFVDVKTDGAATWPAVVSALAPLRAAGLLTTYNGTRGGVTPGPVTVVGTGNTPVSNFSEPAQHRDYFLDAQLALLNTTQQNVTSDISPIASGSFGRYVGKVHFNASEADGAGAGVLNATQVEIARDLVQTARERGIMARFWDTPGWPIRERDGVWRALTGLGVGLLNADDLKAAAGYVGESTASVW